MRRVTPGKYLQRLSIAQKFSLLIGLVALILALELASLWFALGTVSSIRAYVGGEGLWSRAQKESLSSLLRYSTSFREEEYERFRRALEIPLGDRQARLELEKPNPDLAVAREGFLRGGNHPEDIDGMIALFRRFRSVSYVDQAVRIWTEGDAGIERQLELGMQMHARINAAPYGAHTYTEIKPLIAAALANDAALSELETRFSATLSEASRKITTVLFYAILVLTLVLGLCALMVALFIIRLLTRVDRIKTEFVALASHQLRSPLSVIGLSLEYLRAVGATRTAEEERVIDDIGREVERMGSLVGTILNISRIELGTLTVEAESLDLVAVAKAQVDAVSVMARGKEITITEHYSAESLPFVADRTLLEVVLQNLLTNAIKYTPRGGAVTLSVGVRPSEIVLSVSDTGHGIPPEERPHIFHKLFRASNARRLDPQGTGLGLYIVRSIVQETGGKVWFESGEGVGTTFYVSFPSSGMRQVHGNTKLQ